MKSNEGSFIENNYEIFFALQSSLLYRQNMIQTEMRPDRNLPFSPRTPNRRLPKRANLHQRDPPC